MVWHVGKRRVEDLEDILSQGVFGVQIIQHRLAIYFEAFISQLQRN